MLLLRFLPIQRNSYFYFLVDTESDVCILPYSCYRKYFSRNLSNFSNATFRNFDKSEVRVTRLLEKALCAFNGRSAYVDFIICDLDVAVLGVNAISKLNMSVSGQATELVTYSIDRNMKSEIKTEQS